MAALRLLKPLPPKPGSIRAEGDASGIHLPGQTAHSAVPALPLRDIKALDTTPFPGKNAFPAHLRSNPSLIASSPSAPTPAAVVDTPSGETKTFDASKLPFFFCKISARHLPRLDVFSPSDPVCFVRDVGGNVIVHRTEVIPDDSEPDFQKQLRLKPESSTAQSHGIAQAYQYNPQDVLAFSFYDSCRKDSLASSKELTDADLEPLGSANVSVADMLRRIEMHNADPRTPLHIKCKLHRDSKQSTMSKTFEQLGSLHSKMNIFTQPSSKAPKLVLHLTLIKSISSNQRFCWQKDDFWRVIDRGSEVAHDEETTTTIVTLLEMNPSHLSTIETAVAKPAAINDEASAGADLASTVAAPPTILTLVFSAFGFKLACLGEKAADLEESSDFQMLVRVMNDLKNAALNRAQDFYAVEAQGGPAVVFPFVLSLHTLKEDLGVRDEAGLVDWWDVLNELRRGLLLCAERCSQEGRPVLQELKTLYECGEFCISSIEEGVECEFQWMICQQWTNRTMRLNDAYDEVKKLNLTRSIANEYTGENVLHVLIVQGGSTDSNISKLFNLVTLNRYKLCLLNAEVSGRFFCPVNSGGIINLGLTPLHFAVSTGQAPVVQALLKQCGDSKQRHHLLWKRDSLGNTILHMCVTHNMQTMFDILMNCLWDLEKELQNTEWWHIKPRRSIADDDNLKNHDGHTPVEYAAIKGNRSFICHIMERDKILKWAYGSVSLNLFLVRDFDTYKTLTCDRAPKLEAGAEAKKLSYLQYVFKNFAAYTSARPSVEPNVLDLLVEHEHKSLLTTLPLVQGLLDHKWQTFGRQLLSTWGVIVTVIFIIFEINVYTAAGRTSLETFTELEYVQISCALAVLIGTFCYLADLGLPHVPDKNDHGIPCKYRIHKPEEYDAVKLKRLVGSEMPSWMMMQALEDGRRRVAAINTDDEIGKAQKKHLGHLMDEYERFILEDSCLNRKSGTKLPSLQQYMRDCSCDDSYLEIRDVSVLTRSGGKLLPQTNAPEEFRIKRMSLANLQQNMKDLGASVRDMTGSLQKKFNEAVLGDEASDVDVAQNKTENVFAALQLLIRFSYHVFVRGATDGINSMLQLWALLILISSLLRGLGISDIEVINTALMSLASLSFFVSLAAFYRVNSSLGPFMVLLNTMLATDLVTWLFIVVLFLAGTGQALYIIQDSPIVFLGVYKWMLGDSSTDSAADLISTYQAYVVIVFVALSLILSVALLNVLVAMFGSTYEKVMESAREEWQLQRALTILLLERVLYFLPAALIYPLGYRVLPQGPGRRKVIMRFVWRDGGSKYHWVNTRCAVRNTINASHSEILLDAAEYGGAKTVFVAKWHSFFTAQVPRYVAEYNQVESDDNNVYLLQMISSAKKDQYRVPDEKPNNGQ